MMGHRFMLEVILNFLSNSYVGQPTLHTRKINQHIARLRQFIMMNSTAAYFLPIVNHTYFIP